MKLLDWRVVGLSAGSFLSITYVLCVVYDLLFPEYAMYEVWMKLLPGFVWISWWSFLLGLVETFLYGIYTGLVFAPLYNFFNMRLSRVD
ncbi:MAG TPA: hypothetical protein ENK42_01540 [Deltaproteobacteria bacterium]|nr:hypothetical protein [Deltaproteobacteria bacterium]